MRVVRLERVGRSAARNTGAKRASGRTLLFLDDDMSVHTGLLEAHLRAQTQWRNVLAVGAVRLPEEALGTPFGRFRQKLEDMGSPRERGIATAPNFCSAANMSIERSAFLELDGFDPQLSSAEDQDFALRHSARGGLIAYLPEARAIHRDRALDIRSYCLRVEMGAEHDVAFVHKQPDWKENRERDRVNGPVALGQERLALSLRKAAKVALGSRPLQEAIFAMAALLEQVAPDSWALDTIYRTLLGIHILRGYRRGLRGTDRTEVGKPKSSNRSL